MVHLLALLTLAACGNPDYPPPDPLPAELTTCDVPEDCVVVELGCCDACNGGVVVAVHADHAAETRDTYSERCSGNTACTLVACAPNTADCIDSTCTVVTGTWD